MAYYDTINLVKGDTLPELNLTLRDSNTAATGQVLNAEDASTWAPIDLTSTTVRLKFKALGSTDVKVFMLWPAGVLDAAGTFIGEVEITKDSGGVHTVFDQLKFKVRGDY